MKIVSIIACAGIGALLAGCSSGGSSPGGISCPTIMQPAPTLVSPAPGATGVSTAIGSLTVQLASLPETAVLQPQSGPPVSLGPIMAAAAPATTETLSVPPLAAHTTYAVIFSGMASGCGSTSATIGSFTTQ